MKSNKPKKTARIDMRVVPELDERAKHFANCLSISRNELIEKAIWNFVLDTEKFALCPTCKDPIFEKERMPILEGVQEIECVNKHVHTYDFEKDDFI